MSRNKAPYLVLSLISENEAGYAVSGVELLEKAAEEGEVYRLQPEARPPGLQTPHLDLARRLVIHPEAVTMPATFVHHATPHVVAGILDFAITELPLHKARRQYYRMRSLSYRIPYSITRSPQCPDVPCHRQRHCFRMGNETVAAYTRSLPTGTDTAHSTLVTFPNVNRWISY